MDNTTKVPVKVIENWFRQQVITMVKNFQELGVPSKFETMEDEFHFSTGAWKGAEPFLETEYNTWIDAANPMEICDNCGHQKFITKK